MKTTFKYSLLFINLLGLLVLCGCSEGDSKYNEIYKTATSSLSNLTDSINEMSSYAYTKQYEEIEAKYNSAVEALKLEVADNEKETAKLDTMVKAFSSLAESEAAIEALKDKNQTILDSIVNKRWIRLDPKGEGDINTNLVFYFTDSLINVQGYKKKFPFELKDGNIYTESIGYIYCTLTDSTLVLQNESGTEAHYRLATFNERMAGYWISKNHTMRLNLSIRFNKNGTCSYLDHRLYECTYSFKNGEMTVRGKFTMNSSYYQTISFYYKFIPKNDSFKLYQWYDGYDGDFNSISGTLTRFEEKGPKSLSILFDREGDDD